MTDNTKRSAENMGVDEFLKLIDDTNAFLAIYAINLPERVAVNAEGLVREAWHAATKAAYAEMLPGLEVGLDSALENLGRAENLSVLVRNKALSKDEEKMLIDTLQAAITKITDLLGEEEGEMNNGK
jgi:hypothetical protein